MQKCWGIIVFIFLLNAEVWYLLYRCLQNIKISCLVSACCCVFSYDLKHGYVLRETPRDCLKSAHKNDANLALPDFLWFFIVYPARTVRKAS